MTEIRTGGKRETPGVWYDQEGPTVFRIRKGELPLATVTRMIDCGMWTTEQLNEIAMLLCVHLGTVYGMGPFTHMCGTETEEEEQ